MQQWHSKCDVIKETTLLLRSYTDQEKDAAICQEAPEKGIRCHVTCKFVCLECAYGITKHHSNVFERKQEWRKEK